MKLLRVRASNYKNCCDDFMIDFVAKSKKTSEDKEYELLEIADQLYGFNTVMITGKNASGKTTAIELLDCCYSLLGKFCIKDYHQIFDDVSLEMIFYHDNFIYKYNTMLQGVGDISLNVNFINQHLYRKKYYKSKVKEIFSDTGFEEIKNIGALPEDTSILFRVLKKKTTEALYFDSRKMDACIFQNVYELVQKFNLPEVLLNKISHLFDENIQSLSVKDSGYSVLIYNNQVYEMPTEDLFHWLSEGTSKGMLLYAMAAVVLQIGGTLLIDEIESQIDRKLIENLIALFKDKSVNCKSASLIFTTHQYELLDLTNRQDNIWIAKSAEKVYLENLYETYNIRPELSKSRQFYNNVFNTEVAYKRLIEFKKELL